MGEEERVVLSEFPARKKDNMVGQRGCSIRKEKEGRKEKAPKRTSILTAPPSPQKISVGLSSLYRSRTDEKVECWRIALLVGRMVSASRSKSATRRCDGHELQGDSLVEVAELEEPVDVELSDSSPAVMSSSSS